MLALTQILQLLEDLSQDPVLGLCFWTPPRHFQIAAVAECFYKRYYSFILEVIPCELTLTNILLNNSAYIHRVSKKHVTLFI